MKHVFLCILYLVSHSVNITSISHNCIYVTVYDSHFVVRKCSCIASIPLFPPRRHSTERTGTAWEWGIRMRTCCVWGNGSQISQINIMSPLLKWHKVGEMIFILGKCKNILMRMIHLLIIDDPSFRIISQSSVVRLWNGISSAEALNNTPAVLDFELSWCCGWGVVGGWLHAQTSIKESRMTQSRGVIHSSPADSLTALSFNFCLFFPFLSWFSRAKWILRCQRVRGRMIGEGA